jgi:hypothetical protein
VKHLIQFTVYIESRLRHQEMGGKSEVIEPQDEGHREYSYESIS